MSWDFLAALPSTNVRIASSILMALATGVRVVALGWQPPIPWLTFLVAWGGLDVGQYLGKRFSDSDYISATKGNVPSPPAVPPVKAEAAEEPTPPPPKKKKAKGHE